MHGIPVAVIERTIAGAGLELLQTQRDGAAPGWSSATYYGRVPTLFSLVREEQQAGGELSRARRRTPTRATAPSPGGQRVRRRWQAAPRRDRKRA